MRLACDRAKIAIRKIAILTVLTSCSGASEPVTPRATSLVAAGRVVDAAGSPIERAGIHIQALWSGRQGGDFGCSGTALVGDWLLFADPNGAFTSEMRLGATGTVAPVCVVVLGMRPDDSAWRDTASVVAAFKPVAEGVAPDTVRFALRFGP
jgi:hypothetical protein